MTKFQIQTSSSRTFELPDYDIADGPSFMPVDCMFDDPEET